MTCEQYRQRAGAELDGEAASGGTTAGDPAARAAHLATCADCAAWQRDVEALTRRARVQPATPVPAHVTTAVLAAIVLPDRRIRRRIAALRIALAVIGVVQIGIAVPAFVDADMGMAMSVHASHESAAWNVAVGLAVLFVAWRPFRVAGALAAVGAFVAVLAVLSAVDIASGAVGADRLLTHLGVLAAAVVMTALQRAQRGWPERRPADPARAVGAAGATPRRLTSRGRNRPAA